MSDYTPDPNVLPIGYDLPDDGDAKPVSSVNPTLEGLADGLAHATWPETDATKRYPLLSRTVRRTQSGLWRFAPAECAWDVSNPGINLSDGLLMTTLGKNAYLVLDLPDLCSLLSVECTLQGAGSHGAVPTGTDRFALELFVGVALETEISTTTGGVGFSTIEYDPTTSVPVYENIHTLTHALAVPWLFHRNIQRMILRAKNEAGGSGVAGLRIIEVAANYTVTSVDPG